MAFESAVHGICCPPPIASSFPGMLKVLFLALFWALPITLTAVSQDEDLAPASPQASTWG